jgi:hypothetical protein
MRKCVLCGKEYEFCPTCNKDKHKPMWYKLYHDENCKNIFDALNNYHFELTTKEEAKDILSKCDLSIELADNYRHEIHTIMTEPKKNKQVKKVEEIEEVKEEPKAEIEPEVEA